MDKAPDAFRTISEVAEVLETPAHVLRFWESRFPQIKPVKRAGGRRYYRPADVALLSGIRQLLHAEGMTIRGVQKILREQGVRHVAGLGGDAGAMDLEAEGDLPDQESETTSAEVHAMPTPPRRAADPAAPLGPPAEVQPLFAPPAEVTPQPAALPFDLPATESAVPREGEGGFIAFSNPRRPGSRPRPVADDPLQPTLPFAASPAAEVPEAPHLWVETEDESEPPASLHDFAAETAPPDLVHPVSERSVSESKGSAPPDSVAPDSAPPDATPSDEVADPADLAARLRALFAVSAAGRSELANLHSRLGLLHAQMAEAVRLRR